MARMARRGSPSRVVEALSPSNAVWKGWGVSVWSAAEIAMALEQADARLAPRPISNQPPYNLLERGIEADVLPFCASEGLGQLVFSPLAQGILTGKYSAGRLPEGSRAADGKRNIFMKQKMSRENLDRVDRMAKLARELSLEPAQLALAWCLRDPRVSSAIVGATCPEQVRENARAAGVRLPPEALARLDDLFPGPGPREA